MKNRGLNIHLSNRLSYTLIAIGILAVIGVGVYAYGTTVPSTFGHSAGELAPPSPCISNQVLQWSGTAWTCITLPSQAQWPYLQDIKLTSASHNGDFTGYVGMYNWIQANGCSGYHVCTSSEIVNAVQSGMLSTMYNHAWYSTATLAIYPTGTSSSVMVNDCQGWKYAGTSAMGAVLSNYTLQLPRSVYPSVVYCSYTFPVLCCK